MKPKDILYYALFPFFCILVFIAYAWWLIAVFVEVWREQHGKPVLRNQR